MCEYFHAKRCSSRKSIIFSHAYHQTPDDSCWPSTSEWAILKDTLSGRLIKTVPPGSVCYPSQPDYNYAACQYVITHWTTSAFHSSSPSSVSDPFWSNSSCTPIYPNGTSLSGDPDAPSKGCSLGNLSPYVINATEASHVQAALKFAKAHNLRLNIKNTGHNPEKRYETRSHIFNLVH